MSKITKLVRNINRDSSHAHIELTIYYSLYVLTNHFLFLCAYSCLLLHLFSHNCELPCVDIYIFFALLTVRRRAMATTSHTNEEIRNCLKVLITSSNKNNYKVKNEDFKKKTGFQKIITEIRLRWFPTVVGHVVRHL